MIARALRAGTVLVATAALVALVIATRARGRVDRAWLDREATVAERTPNRTGGAVELRLGAVQATTRTGASPHAPGALLRALAGACTDESAEALAAIARGRAPLPAAAEPSLGVDLALGPHEGALVCVRPSRHDDALVAITAREGSLSTRFEMVSARLPDSLDELVPREVPTLLAPLPASLTPQLVSEAREGTRRLVVASSSAPVATVRAELEASLGAARTLVESQRGVIRARRAGVTAWISLREQGSGTFVTWIESHETALEGTEEAWTTAAQ